MVKLNSGVDNVAHPAGMTGATVPVSVYWIRRSSITANSARFTFLFGPNVPSA